MRNWLIVIGVVLVVIYFLNKDKVNGYFKSTEKKAAEPEAKPCMKQVIGIGGQPKMVPCDWEYKKQLTITRDTPKVDFGAVNIGSNSGLGTPSGTLTIV